jgi:hypothetical protein
VLEAVEIPVLAAGGIGTARAMAATLAAGAAGVRVGTRLVAAKESGAHPAYIDALIAAAADDTVVTETFSTDWPNAPHRVLRSSIEAATANHTEPVGYAEDGWAIPRLHPALPERGTTGHIEAMALYAGESVDGVKGFSPPNRSCANSRRVRSSSCAAGANGAVTTSRTSAHIDTRPQVHHDLFHQPGLLPETQKGVSKPLIF